MTTRLLRLVCVCCAAAAVLCAQAKGDSAGPAAPKRANAKPAAAPAPRLVDPGSLAAQLMRAAPEERERALARFPAERQEQLRKQLTWFDALAKEQQEIQIRRIERFAGLSTQRQAVAREQIRAFNQLPAARKQAVRRALTLMQSLTPAQRAKRLRAPSFQRRYSENERKIIEDLSEALLPQI
jgi:hypothetical protein